MSHDSFSTRVTGLNGMSLNTSPKKTRSLPNAPFLVEEILCFQCSRRQRQFILAFQHHHISSLVTTNQLLDLSYPIPSIDPMGMSLLMTTWVVSNPFATYMQPPLQSYRYTFLFDHHRLGSYCLMVQKSQTTTWHV